MSRWLRNSPLITILAALAVICADSYAQNAQKRYDDYYSRVEADYNAWAKKVKAIWGGDSIVDSTPTRWVEYSEDLMSRSIVDFDKGTAFVELAVGANSLSPEELSQRMENAIENFLGSRGTVNPYNDNYNVALSRNPIMDDLVDYNAMGITDPSEPLSRDIKARNHATPAKRKAAAANLSHNTYRSRAASGTQVVYAKVPVSPNALSQNAAQYSKIVTANANRFGVSESLIYAIMEQESRFNPMARSYIPAYGLMQIVPTTAGRDAYRYVYDVDEIPTAEFLYMPEYNIEMGVAYLKVLFRQFSKIEDEFCRELCVIASYNTGAGNVSRAFTGSTNLSKAIPLINNYDYFQLYDYLTTHLGSSEARNYVKGVTDRREKYLEDDF